MSTYLINIVANSNFAATINKDTAAITGNTAALEANTLAMKENGVKIGALEVAGVKLRKRQQETVTGFDALIKRVREVNQWLGRMSGSSDTVGYNFMGLSLRIGQWVIPALILLVSAMMPVITALLAMGAAAGVAGLGLLTVLGLGAVLMAHRMNQAGPLNQPEGFAGSGTNTIFTQLLKPIWATLDEPGLAGVTTNAVLFVQTLFGDTIPKALRAFLSNIDPGTMMVIEQLFTRWLPDMAGSLTRWGSKLFNVIGTGSLSRLNAFFKYIAGGIMNAADWLNGNGWQQMDNVSAIISDIISTLMALGKEALPTLLTVLNQVWPVPLKAILEGMTTFLQEVNKNPAALDTLAKIAQALASIVLLNMAVGMLTTVISVLTSVVTIFAAIAAGALIIGWLFITVLYEIVVRLLWFGEAILTFFVDLVTSILDAVKAVVTGGEFTTSIGKADKYLGIMNGGEGAWGGVGFAKWNEDMIKNSTVGAWNLGASGVQTLRVVFDPNFVDKTAMEQANRTLGSNVSWDVANSQFSRGASM